MFVVCNRYGFSLHWASNTSKKNWEVKKNYSYLEKKISLFCSGN